MGEQYARRLPSTAWPVFQTTPTLGMLTFPSTPPELQQFLQRGLPGGGGGLSNKAFGTHWTALSKICLGQQLDNNLSKVRKSKTWPRNISRRPEIDMDSTRLGAGNKGLGQSGVAADQIQVKSTNLNSI